MTSPFRMICGLATRYIRSIVSCHRPDVVGGTRTFDSHSTIMISSLNLLVTSLRYQRGSLAKCFSEIPEKDLPARLKCTTTRPSDTLSYTFQQVRQHSGLEAGKKFNHTGLLSQREVFGKSLSRSLRETLPCLADKLPSNSKAQSPPKLPCELAECCARRRRRQQLSIANNFRTDSP